MQKSKFRGHNIIIFANGECIYEDTKTPTVGNERDCGYCGGGSDDRVVGLERRKS